MTGLGPHAPDKRDRGLVEGDSNKEELSQGEQHPHGPRESWHWPHYAEAFRNARTAGKAVKVHVLSMEIPERMF
jgi:hypothetical protein